MESKVDVAPAIIIIIDESDYELDISRFDDGGRPINSFYDIRRKSAHSIARYGPLESCRQNLRRHSCSVR